VERGSVVEEGHEGLPKMFRTEPPAGRNSHRAILRMDTGGGDGGGPRHSGGGLGK